MSKNLPELITEERELLNEEAWLVAALEKIKSHRISLQVERLQLQSMLNQKTDNFEAESAHLKGDNIVEKIDKIQPIGQSVNIVETVPTTSIVISIPPLEELDQAESLCNNKKLNLSIMNDIDMLLGTYHDRDDMKEEESSDEGW